MSLEKLNLLFARPPSYRAEDIDDLNIRPRRRTGVLEQRRKLRDHISEVVLGVRAPAAAAKNWPNMVDIGMFYPPPLKVCAPNEGGMCHYERKSATSNN